MTAFTLVIAARRLPLSLGRDPETDSSIHNGASAVPDRDPPPPRAPPRLLRRAPTRRSLSGAVRLRKSSSIASLVTRSSSGLTDATADDEAGVGIVDARTRERAVRAAEAAGVQFRGRLPKSLAAAHDGRDTVAPFAREEIVLGPRLGSGEFSHVYEVKSFKLNLESDFAEDGKALSAEETERRVELKEHEQYRESNNARYAVKHIQEDYFRRHSPGSYVQAASDLATEAEFLASLVHPNIIKLRGISLGGAAGFAEGPSGYFLIIDRLFETLEDRLERWRARPPRRGGGRLGGLRSRVSCIRKVAGADEVVIGAASATNAESGKKALDERLGIAVQLSAALTHLHKHSVIFRDLKPANIGFDVRGDVKIFDFGLARTVPDGDGNTDKFVMSGAGSPRYMAPECLMSLPYNLKADVYSFSIVLWEMLSGVTPYVFIRGMHQLRQYVVMEDGRPKIDPGWPSAVRGMMESSFDVEMDKRPKMTLWYNTIREELVTLRGGDRRGLTDTYIARRRTQHSGGNLMKGLTREDIM